MLPADFRALFSKFKSATDDEINAQISLSAAHLNVNRMGAFYNEALANFIAHGLCLGKSDTDITDANDVVGRSTEKQHTMRSAAEIEAQRKDPFLRTTYGQRYRYLKTLANMGALVT